MIGRSDQARIAGIRSPPSPRRLGSPAVPPRWPARCRPRRGHPIAERPAGEGIPPTGYSTPPRCRVSPTRCACSSATSSACTDRRRRRSSPPDSTSRAGRRAITSASSRSTASSRRTRAAASGRERWWRRVPGRITIEGHTPRRGEPRPHVTRPSSCSTSSTGPSRRASRTGGTTTSGGRACLG